MIDIENAVYSEIKRTLTASESSLTIGLGYEQMPSVFPYLSVEEDVNSIYWGTSTNETENHALIRYQISIFTRGNTKKSEAKRIAKRTDDIMNRLGFQRVFRNTMVNFEQSEAYRLDLFYEGIVSRGHTIYRR